jgi:hypothetical protein
MSWKDSIFNLTGSCSFVDKQKAYDFWCQHGGFLLIEKGKFTCDVFIVADENEDTLGYEIGNKIMPFFKLVQVKKDDWDADFIRNNEYILEEEFLRNIC